MIQIVAMSGGVETALSVGLVGVQVGACVLIADFVSGFAHWLEDSYGSPRTPIVGKWVIEPNIVHHRDPRDFLKHSYWSSADVPLVVAGLVLLGAWWIGWFHWMLALVLAIAVNANQIHKWAHKSRTENGKFIVALQRLRLIQTPAHHAGHHRGGKDRRYCTVTNMTNVVLDGIQFWRGLEWVLLKVVGLKKRGEPGEGAGEREHEHERKRERERETEAV